MLLKKLLELPQVLVELLLLLLLLLMVVRVKHHGVFLSLSSRRR